MVHETEERWPKYHAEIPARMGTIKNIEKFDATFFGVPYKQTNTMDPQCRILIETAYEAILDAGICPKNSTWFENRLLHWCLFWGIGKNFLL